MKRVIVHSDINHCYAQIEEMQNPALRNIAMAVGGSEEKRNGIILAKNDIAKEYGIKTGESLRDAKRKCPDLVIIHPDYDAYTYYTEKVKDIYRKYTDRVESFGLDEAWIDLTDSQSLFGDGIALAQKIQDEVYETLGLTVSMGVSFNKVFAKLASDVLKHKGFVVITEENFKKTVWPMPAEDLLMVGSRTKKKLNEMGIFTIGELARTPESKLERRFGVIGSLLWTYANGLDKTPVAHIHDKVPIKSIGNSKTVVKDIESLDQLQEVFRVLSETVAVRLRKEGLKAKSISIWLRDTDLKGRQGCGKFKQPTDLSKDILERAMELTWKMGLDEISLRSVGIHVSGLCPDIGCDQLDLFHTADYRKKERLTEEVMYEIRKLYGYQACRMASSRVDAVLTDFDPLSLLHEVHPIGVLKGPVKRT